MKFYVGMALKTAASLLQRHKAMSPCQRAARHTSQRGRQKKMAVWRMDHPDILSWSFC